jgi:hypothetical protein
VEEDIEEMRAEERAQQAEATISMLQLICSPTLRSPLIIGVVMQLSQQLSGINAVSVFKYSVIKRIFGPCGGGELKNRELCSVRPSWFALFIC